MTTASFIGGDWGTSHLRLSLCDAQGHSLDTRGGPGAAAIGSGIPDAADRSQAFAQTLATLTLGWQESHGALPTILCGMVGSSIGWTQAPYVTCPTNLEQLTRACVPLHAGLVHIVPGLSCRNPCGALDVLRGEETQILGALQLAPHLSKGCWLLCLPGTHTKWVVVQEGLVREFLTAPTGELFATLCRHSVLVSQRDSVPSTIDTGAFEDGLARFNEIPQADLLHRLFECRSRQLAGELDPSVAHAFLSGLLIASDVRGALRVLSHRTAPSVYLIGSPHLTRLYAIALAAHACGTFAIAGDSAVLAGLTLLHRQLAEGTPRVN